MKKFLLYGHGGARNHGAEAIIRTTAKILPGQVMLSDHFPEQDREFGLDRLVDRLIPADIGLLQQEKAAGDLLQKESICREIYRDALRVIDADTVCLAVGGDNYCYPNWHRQALFHATAKARGACSVLWCCSVEPEMMDDAMVQVLRQHDRIYAREHQTLQALQAHGVGACWLPDPAFLLDTKPTEIPHGFQAGQTAGVNLSPLILRKAPEVLDAYTDAVRWLIQNAGSVLLLPHVTMAVDDDCKALDALYSRLTPREQQAVCRVSGNPDARQLKYLISQCSMLLCSRTHASIGAYSSCVPAVVLGYSVKSAGIGQDLGMEDYVIPYARSRELLDAVRDCWMQRREISGLLEEKTEKIQKVWADFRPDW